MTIRCLICNSSAVLSQQEAQTIALLIGALEGFLKGVQSPDIASGHTVASPLGHTLRIIAEGISGVESNWADVQGFIRENRKFHFMGHERLCLRCGALFSSLSTESPPDG
ncbi:TPA: hypothetical protein ACKPYC_005570 [Pseudomonas aeruginosa]|uniref:hypothetical protein n=1 Tax=Pseudomonas aeruginosa TaxID=287 RepID=UPI00053E4E41|nr:hypothetical protein [Pseudomonas aeruginosa]SAJ28387.1 Uncharacterised protein [Enterobacter cloacae]ASD19943.1 hypothetical protein CD799_30845 [Pseudomonas aeruginosa]AZM84165.1 hypothetical protein EIP87_19765 [Pseudomonas aeruginosa]AZZ15894.1 hypothetical protein CEK59_31125 [Pseudomonas aeruginosa]EKW7757991.1 hypothetical protein [Pseudomonas aeruginosa]